MVRAWTADRPVSLGHVLLIRHVSHVKRVYAREAFRILLVLVWIAALVSAVLLYRWGIKFQSHAALLGLGIALGGAAGNLLDIIRYRCVRDFIDLHWWPVFNLADVGIVAGLVLAFWPSY